MKDMKIFTDPLHELKNQAVHLLIGQFCYLSLSYFFGIPLFGIASMVLLLSITIETVQYFLFDNQNPNFKGRALDCFSYQLGVFYTFFITGGI